MILNGHANFTHYQRYCCYTDAIAQTDCYVQSSSKVYDHLHKSGIFVENDRTIWLILCHISFLFSKNIVTLQMFLVKPKYCNKIF